MIDRPLTTAFIQTPCPELEDDRLEPPLGQLYLATWLRLKGYQAHVVDLSSHAPARIESEVPRADVFGFSTYTATYHRTVAIMRRLRQIYPQAVMVAGGPHASALPRRTAELFDHVVVGEGELTMERLVETLGRGETPPKVLPESVVQDLNALPFPDYELVDLETYSRVVEGRQALSVLTSRGCPYRCVFCNSVVMGRSRRLRFRSAENVAEEIFALRSRWGVDHFRFQDDTFTLNLPRLRRLTELLRDAGITYRCFGRLDRCTREVTDLLYEGGCRHVAFGVESGSPRILRRMRKGQTVEDIRRGIRNAKEAGLRVRVYIIVGFPGETSETIRKTVDLMQECRPDEFTVYPLIPYPGTALYEHPEHFGITHLDPDFSRYFQVARGRSTGFVFRTANLDEDRIGEMRREVIENMPPESVWSGDSEEYK